MTYTHDGQPVYPPDAELPPDAIGWTQCNDLGGAHAEWIAQEDVSRAKESRQAVLAIVEKMQRADVIEALRVRGWNQSAPLKLLRTALINRMYATLWPMRQAAK